MPRNTAVIITFKEALRSEEICDTPDEDIHNKYITINGQSVMACDGQDLNQNNIKIFETGSGVELSDDVDAAAFAAGAVVMTNDNKTFVFRPKSYLGSPTQNQWYGVRLFGDALKKQNGDNVVLSPISDNFYQWKFEVNTRLDLEPPRVDSVFPHPDNEQDSRAATQGAKPASGTITVSSVPRVYAERTQNVDGAQRVEGSRYECSYTYTDSNVVKDGGAVKYTRSTSTDGGQDDLVLSTNSLGFLASAAINNNIAGIGCGLSLDVTGVGADGGVVTLTVAPEQPADWIAVGGRRYVFGDDIIFNDTDAGYVIAGKILTALANNSQITATISGPPNQIIITARTAGIAGNSIALSTSDNARVAVSAANLQGGTDEQEQTTVNGLADVARNAVVQINFNEAMNPLQLQGTSASVASFIQVRVAGGTTPVVGDFIISNVYRTVEFLPTGGECGENMCGEMRYCLPANAKIEVWTKAASLFDCTDNDSCNAVNGGFGRYGTCSNSVCSDSTNNNNPQANASMDGAMDIAFNSLDGDMNTKAEGPQSQNNQPPFNYNALLADDGKTIDRSKLVSAQSNSGDDFIWSFWVSDKIDNDSPVVVSATQAQLGLVNGSGEQIAGANIETPLSMLFNKLMLSSSLKPGRNYPDDFYVTDGEGQIHKEYFVFAKFTGRPLGYWVKKEDRDAAGSDGYNDQTEAIVAHTPFAETSAYGFVSGSGLKDIYQNCYNPAADQAQGGSACDAGLEAGDSCCKGVKLENGDTDTNGDGKKDMCYEF